MNRGEPSSSNLNIVCTIGDVVMCSEQLTIEVDVLLLFDDSYSVIYVANIALNVVWLVTIDREVFFHWLFINVRFVFVRFLDISFLAFVVDQSFIEVNY